MAESKFTFVNIVNFAYLSYNENMIGDCKGIVFKYKNNGAR